MILRYSLTSSDRLIADDSPLQNAGHLLRTDRDRWATERSRLNDEMQEKVAAFERTVAEYRRQLGLLPFRR